MDPNSFPKTPKSPAPNCSMKVRVAVRSRPLIQREKENSDEIMWNTELTTISNIVKKNQGNSNSTQNSTHRFEFDHVFGTETSTEQVYSAVVGPIVQKAMDGFNGTVLCYGQTSSGKTHTLYGNDDSPGIISLTSQDLLGRIKNDSTRQYILRVGLLEIYNENLHDLLNSENPIDIVQNKDGFVVPKDINELEVLTEEDMTKAANRVQRERKIGETRMNKESSRSHTILRITVQSYARGAPEGTMTTAMLNFVDLAGSEKSAQTGAQGERLKEANHINKSLSSLSSVVMQLSRSSKNVNHGVVSSASSSSGVSKNKVNPHFINYRDSKLTRILQSSLSGNAFVAMICNVTPASFDETLSTLRFAAAAKLVKIRPQKNTLNKVESQHLEERVRELQIQLQEKIVETDDLKRRLEILQSVNNRDQLCEVNDRRRTICPSELEQLGRGNGPSDENYEKLDDITAPFDFPKPISYNTRKRKSMMLSMSSDISSGCDSFDSDFSSPGFDSNGMLTHEDTLRKILRSTKRSAERHKQQKGSPKAKRSKTKALTAIETQTTPSLVGPVTRARRRLTSVNNDTPVDVVRTSRSVLRECVETDRNEWEQEKQFLSQELELHKEEEKKKISEAIEKHNTEASKLVTQLKEQKLEVESLKEEKDYLQNLLKKKASDCETMRDEIVAQCTENAKLRSLLSETENRVCQLEEESKTNKQEVETTSLTPPETTSTSSQTDDSPDLQKYIDELKSDLLVLRECVNGVDTERRKWETVETQLHQDLDDLRVQIKSQSMEIQKQQTLLNEKEIGMSKLQRVLNTKEEDRVELQLAYEIEKTKNEACETMRDQITAQCTEIEKLRSLLSESENRISQLTEELKTIKQEVETTSLTPPEITSTSSQTDDSPDLQKYIDELKSELLVARECANGVDTQRRKWETMETKLNYDLDQLRMKIRDQSLQIQRQKTELDDNQEVISELHTVADCQEEDRVELQSMYESEKNKNKAWETRWSANFREIERLRDLLSETENRISQLTEELKTIKQEVETTGLTPPETTTTSSQTDDSPDLQKYVDELKSELLVARECANGVDYERRKWEIVENQLHEDIDYYRAQIKSQSLEIQKQQTVLNEKEVRMSELQRVVSTKEEDRMELQFAYEAEKTKNEACETMRDQIVAQCTEIEKLRSMLSIAENRVSQLEEDRAQLQLVCETEKTKNEAYETMRDQITAQCTEIEKLRDLLSETENRISQLTEELKTIKQEVETTSLTPPEITSTSSQTDDSPDLQKYIDELKSELLVARECANGVDYERRKWEIVENQLHEDIDDYRAQIKSQSLEIQKQQTVLNEKEVRMSELQRVVSTKEEDRMELQLAYEMEKTKNKSLSASVAAKKDCMKAEKACQTGDSIDLNKYATNMKLNALVFQKALSKETDLRKQVEEKLRKRISSCICDELRNHPEGLSAAISARKKVDTESRYTQTDCDSSALERMNEDLETEITVKRLRTQCKLETNRIIEKIARQDVQNSAVCTPSSSQSNSDGLIIPSKNELKEKQDEQPGHLTETEEEEDFIQTLWRTDR